MNPTCIRCGLANAALPLVMCVPCWAVVRDVPAYELVDTSAIASRADVEPDTVRKWAARHATFPRPVLSLAAGQVWRWDAVREWLEATGRPQATTEETSRGRKQ